MKEKLKVITVIHFALCVGLIFAYLVVGDIQSIAELKLPNIDLSNIIYLAIPFLAYFLSNFLFKSQLKNIDSKLTLEEKMPAYITASLIRWAVLEGAALLILFLKRDFMIFGIVIILYLIFIRPTLDKVRMELA